MSDLDKVKQSELARKKTIAEWRAKQINEHELPSGLVVQMRDVDILAMAFDGKIHNTMLGMVDEVTAKNGVIQSEDLTKFGELVNLCVFACVVEPPIAEEADDLHIGIRELTGADRIEIFTIANREVGNLKTFRQVETKSVDVVSPGEDVREAPVETAEAKD
jgi:hypothetical protein